MSFSGVALELAFAHCLAGLFGNTFLRYSLSMGLFLMASGLGSVYFEKLSHKPARTFLAAIEIGLSFLATVSVPLILILATQSPTASALCAYTLMIIIGFLTGLELPLVLQLPNRSSTAYESAVLSFDFAGSGLGGILFGLFLFPALGIFNAVFALGLLNALMAIVLSWRLGSWRWLAIANFIISAMACIFSESITPYLVSIYDHALF